MLLLFHKAKAALIRLSLVLLVPTVLALLSNILPTKNSEKEVLSIAMIAIRMKKFYKKTGRRVHVDGKTPVGFNKKKLNVFIVTTLDHFARE
ncbi:hypothetical protein Tco_0090067 [Tanacetum coccineum]